LSLVSWAQAPLPDAIIATVTMAHAWVETACMIILFAETALSLLRPRSSLKNSAQRPQ